MTVITSIHGQTCANAHAHTHVLQHERRALQRMLGGADVTAAAKNVADKKIGELESAIADMKERTQRVMADLQRQR